MKFDNAHYVIIMYTASIAYMTRDTRWDISCEFAAFTEHEGSQVNNHN